MSSLEAITSDKDETYQTKRKKRVKQSIGILAEVTDPLEKNRLIKMRSLFYSERGITEVRINGEDPFDSYSRFFVLNEPDNDHALCVIRAVNRNNPFRIIPSELSLIDSVKRRELVLKKSGECFGDLWQDSTLTEQDKRNFRRLLNHFQNSKTVYEIGGLFGCTGKVYNPINAILGIGEIGFRENWDLVIQTQHPRHSELYKRIGFPYHALTGEYLDHCKRPAITLFLNGTEFRRNYQAILECM